MILTLKEDIKDSTTKTISKYRNHPCVVAIRNQCKNRASFSFVKVGKIEFKNLILNHDMNKVSQKSNIPLKTVKKNIISSCEL